MQKQSLSGEWQFRQCSTSEWIPAAVPGGVHTDLLALGRIPDPFVADHELKVMWVAENDWEYRYSFTVDPDLLAEENIALVCDGLDTIADIYLNGTYLGHAENMFRRWEWDVCTSPLVPWRASGSSPSMAQMLYSVTTTSMFLQERQSP